jgi:hypothetical protein
MVLVGRTDPWKNAGVAADPPIQVHVDHHALVFSPDGRRLYDGNDGGVWSTANPQAAAIAWKNLNATLVINQYYPSISIHPGDLNLAFGGAQDNGTQRYTGKPVWDYVTCGDGGWTAIDPTQPGTVFAACQSIEVLKSIDGGTTWLEVINGIDKTDRVAFMAPLVIDPSATDDAGHVTRGNEQPGVLRAIGVAPSDPQTVYTGAGTGAVYVTTRVDAHDPARGTSLRFRWIPPIRPLRMSPSPALPA